MILKNIRNGTGTVRSNAIRAIAPMAALFHVLVTIIIFSVGHFEILPEMFDGRGVGYFNDDNFSYMLQLEHLLTLLEERGIFAWLQSDYTIHIKLYSLSFALLKGVFGFTILSAEPLNLIYYLTILWLVYTLGREVYNRRVGLLASGVVGIWPSFLIHTTQVLRTPLYVIALLTLTLAVVRLIIGRRGIVSLLLNGIAGVAALYLLKLMSQARFGLILSFLLFGVIFIVIRIVRAGRVPVWGAIFLMSVLLVGFAYSLWGAFSAVTGAPLPFTETDLPPENDDEPSWESLQNYLDILAAQVGQIRQNFVDFYPDAGSNVDVDYRIDDFEDLVRYLPRALSVGLFEPSPDMWFVEGRTGLSTKVLSGSETLVMYIFEFFAIWSIWRARHRLAAWYLLIVVFIGVTGLGLIVLNVGTLFRLRYAYWILLLVLGVGGLHEVFLPGLQLALSNIPWKIHPLATREHADDAPILIVSNWDWVIYNFRLPLARALMEQGLEVILVCPPGKYTEEMVAKGFRWEAWNLDRRSTYPWREGVAVLELHRIYRKLRPAAVHHFTIKPILYGSLAARAARVPSVINNFTGLGYLFSEARKARVLRWGVLPMLRRALSGDGFHTAFQNEADRGHLIEMGVVEEAATSLIPGTGVSLDRYQPVGDADEMKDELVVIMAARLLWDKGLAEYVEAARAIKGQGLRVRFQLAGEPDMGNPASVTEETLEAWREEGVVELLGHRSDIPALLRQADIAVLPSSYHEGVPLFLLEAAATGLPLVASDIEGCRMVVEPGRNGYLVGQGDAEGLTDALLGLLRDADLRRRMGQESRRIAETRFDQRSILLKYVHLYNKLGVIHYRQHDRN